jgi:hypothetical protein
MVTTSTVPLADLRYPAQPHCRNCLRDCCVGVSPCVALATYLPLLEKRSPSVIMGYLSGYTAVASDPCMVLRAS